MSSDFNTLLHGGAAEAAAILSGDNPPDGLDATQSLRAALTNALTRIDRLERRLEVPAPVMRTYCVTARPLVQTEDLNDLDFEVEGDYEFNAIDREAALDLFHGTVPIKVLDDFDIYCDPVPGIRPPKEDGK